MNLKPIVLRGHTPDCHQASNPSLRWARQERDRWYLTGEHIYRDNLGRRLPKRNHSGGVRWMVLHCNATNCEGMIIVNSEALECLVLDVLLGKAARRRRLEPAALQPSQHEKARQVEDTMLGTPEKLYGKGP